MRLHWVVATALLAASPATLAAQPPGTVEHVTPRAWLYIPRSVAVPAPLIVLFHGAGGNARSFIDDFRRDADSRGAILLALQSEGHTWPQRAPNDDEADVANLKSALTQLPARVSFDGSRAIVAGFSDGASYALSIGLAYPDLFRSIVALSPGYAFAPSRPDTEQKIFITHSRRDPVLPAANVREMIRGLEKAGYSPEVRWFNGGHEIDPDLKKAALDFTLAP